MENSEATPRAPMSDEEYRECQHALMNLAQVALLMPDLGSFLQRIGTALAVGPILDPTLYRRAGGDLERIKELASFAQALQRCARRHAGLPE